MPPTMGSDRLFLTYSEAATEAHFSELCAMPILVGEARLFLMEKPRTVLASGSPIVTPL